MSTVLPTYQEEMANRDASKAGSEATYREAVYAAVETGAPVADSVLEAAWKLRAQADRDIATYRQRLSAQQQLVEEVPRLRKAANEAQKLANATPTYGNRKIDGLTVDQLRVAIKAAEANMLPPEHASARAALDEPSRVERESRQELLRTSDPALANQVLELQHQAENLQHRIEGNERILALPAAIERHKARCEELAAGRGRAIGGGSLADQYRRARLELQELRDKSAGIPTARAAIAQDRSALAELARRKNDSEALRMEPRNMRFSD